MSFISFLASNTTTQHDLPIALRTLLLVRLLSYHLLSPLHYACTYPLSCVYSCNYKWCLIPFSLGTNYDLQYACTLVQWNLRPHSSPTWKVCWRLLLDHHKLDLITKLIGSRPIWCPETTQVFELDYGLVTLSFLWLKWPLSDLLETNQYSYCKWIGLNLLAVQNHRLILIRTRTSININ